MGKNNIKYRNKHLGEKIETYSIKKFKIGAASVLIGVGIFFGTGIVEAKDISAQTKEIQNNSFDESNKSHNTANETKPILNSSENTQEKLNNEGKTKEPTIAQVGEVKDSNSKVPVDKNILSKRIDELKFQIERLKNNSDQKSIINEAKDKLQSAESLLKIVDIQKEVDNMAKELSSYTDVLKSISIDKDNTDLPKEKLKEETLPTESKNDNTNTTTITKLQNSKTELTEAVSKVEGLSSKEDKIKIEQAKTIIEKIKLVLADKSTKEIELLGLYNEVTRSRNSLMNILTRTNSGKRDIRNGKVISKDGRFRADSAVASGILGGELTFVDTNGNSTGKSEAKIPVVSDGDGKRLLKFKLKYSSSSPVAITNGKMRYIIPKKHLNTSVKPTISNSALVDGNPKDISDDENYIYEFKLRTISGGSVGEVNIEQQISSSIDKSPSNNDTTEARVEFYRGDELISTAKATATYDYLSQILYKESDTKANKNILDYIHDDSDADKRFRSNWENGYVLGTKLEDGSFTPTKGSTYALPLIAYDRGKDFMQGSELGDKNGNGRLTDIDYTITGIPEFLELVPSINSNKYWTLEGNVAKLKYDPTSTDIYKRPTRIGVEIGNKGPVFRVKENYFDTPEKINAYLRSANGKGFDIEYKAIGHRPDGTSYTQTLATADNNKLKFYIEDGLGNIPAERMGTSVTTPNKQRLFSSQSDTDEFNVSYGYNDGRIRNPQTGTETVRPLNGNGDKLDNNFFTYSVPKDKNDTYFTYFKLTEANANVLQEDGSRRFTGYNEGNKSDFNFTINKPFKLYGIKEDGTREQLKEMSTVDQLFEEVEIDKSKKFTRLVLEHPDVVDKFLEKGGEFNLLGFRSTVKTTMDKWQEMAANDKITRHENNIDVSLSTNGNSIEAATSMAYPTTVKKTPYNTAVHTKDRYTAELGISPVAPIGDRNAASYDENRGNNKDEISRQKIVPFIVRYKAPEYFNTAIKTVDGKKVLDPTILDENLKNATVMLVTDAGLPLTNFRLPIDNKLYSNKFSTQGRYNYSAGNYEDIVKDTDVVNPDKVIKNYNGTGKTAYIFKAKDLGYKTVDLNLNQINGDGPVALTFEVVNNGQAPNGTYHIDSYLVWDSKAQSLIGKDPSLSADILEGHEPGRTVAKASTDVTLKTASEYFGQLTIAKKDQEGVMGIINVKNGEEVTLSPSVTNAADTPAELKELMVEIPKNYTSPNKVAETALKGPIPNTADYHVEYTTFKGTNAEKTVAPYVRADQITDWSQVTAVKYVFDKVYTLNKGETFKTKFNVTVDPENPNLVEGESQVWLKDGRNNWLESNKVGLVTEDIRGKLNVKHLNLAGNEIMDQYNERNFENEPYTTNSYGLIERARDGKAYVFSHVHEESDPTSGKYVKQQTKKVIYVYSEATRTEERKEVTRTINYVEKDNEGNVIFNKRTFTRPAKRSIYVIKEGPKAGEKIYGPWEKVHDLVPLDWPTEVSPTGNSDYTLVGRKDDETIKNVEKEPIVTWKSPNDDIQVDPVTGKITIPSDKIKAGTEISVVTRDAKQIYTNALPVDNAGNKEVTPLVSQTTRLEITYIPRGRTEAITSIVTKEGNRWTTTDTNIRVNANSGEVTIPKVNRELGKSVTAIAKDAQGNSTSYSPISGFSDAVIKPVTEPFSMEIKYTPAGQDEPVTLTVSRDIIDNKEYTILYEARKGSININYEDTEGNVIKAKQAYVSDQRLKNATDVDGTELTGPNKSGFSMGALPGEKREKFRPGKITLEDGKIYNFRRVKPNTPRDYGNLVEGTTEITYVYELAKGTVRVKYQDTDGRSFGLADKTIKDNVPTGEQYDTTTVENKPPRYETADGKIYELVTTPKTTGGVQYDAQGIRTNVNQTTKAEPSGTVVEGNKEIIYIYELKKGSVVVHYVDTEGNKIKDDRTDKDNVNTGTNYNVTDSTNKPTKITTPEGKIFELVTEAKTEGNLQYDASGVKKDSAAVSGKVKAETLEVTYVYKEKKSAVNVKYVDAQGRPIAGTATMPGDTTEEVTAEGLKPVTEASIKSDYDVTNKKATKITTADGKVYRLINARQGLKEGSKPATGKVEENEITVTYQYELLGSVVTKYELSDGTKLTGALTFDDATTPTTVEEKGLAVANATDVSNGTNYDASTPANKPNKITTATGEVYYLTTLNNGVKAESAPVTGSVEEGKTKEVTYVYEKAGSVVIKYINTDGTEIKTSVQDSTNVKAGTAYNAAENNEKPATIEFNNKKYKLVTKAGNTPTNVTYSAEAVVTNGENVGAATGQVIAGKTLEVTYVYEGVKGNVIVKYVDENGTPLAGTATLPVGSEVVTDAGVKALSETELGTNYATKVAEKKATKITTADGKVYELVAENNGLYNTSEPETGIVTEVDKVVTFVYKEKKSAVNVKYVDKAGQPIAGTATMPNNSTEEVTVDGLKPVTNASVNTDYTVADKKASKITTADGKVYRLIAERDGLLDGSKPASGKVEENEITVTYQYELLGSVVTKYELSDGTKLTGILTFDDATTPTTVEEKGLAVANATDVSNGTTYNAGTSTNKPNKITTASGEVYYLTSINNGLKAGSANETGTVEEGKTKEVTYVYEKAGSIVIKYINTDGTEIKTSVQDSTNVKAGTAYNTAENDEKPATIEFNNKKYKLVTKEGTTTTNATYSAEAVVTNGENVGTVEGQVVAGKTLEVTYVYEEVKGNVIVKYVDETGASLAGAALMPGNTTEEVTVDGVKVVTEAELGTNYADKVAEKKATKITTADGKVYELVAENNGLYNTSEPETGTVTEADKVVTFVYKEKKSAVNVKYVDKAGQPIAGTATMPNNSTETVTTDGLKPVTNISVNSDYNVADKKASKITTAAGKVYRLITEREGLLDGSKPVSGKVEENEITVTYQYELVNGNVTVTYKDTEGNTIEGYEIPKDAEKDAPTGKDFNTATEALKPTKITTPSGKVYNLVPDSTEGKEIGKVTETPQNVTYVYELAKGDVTVSYKDTEGNTIEGYETPKNAEKDAPTGKGFNTVTEALKPTKITTPSGKVYNLVPESTEGKETGKVTEGTQNVTYVYKLAKGDVTVTYKDTEGNTIEGYETPKNAEKAAPTGKDFNTSTEALKPTKITTPSGKVYNLVPESTEGKETGKVTEGTQNVTYVYKLAKGDVTVTYKDTEGNTIEGYETPKNAEKAAPTGKDFDTATNELKPAKITTPSGKVYNLVPTRTEGSETGKVTEAPQNVTYVYELAKGDVTVSYKDTEGNKIPGYEIPKNVETQSPTGKEYTTLTEALKPTKITTPDGKVYNLVPERTEGTESGKVTEAPQNVTYVYELAKGNVTVSYKDTEGNTIEAYETPKDAEKDAPTGKDFDTATNELKPAKITTPSGKVYNLVPTRTEGNENGKVTEAPQNVTYVYVLAKGNVTVTYKDTEGNKIPGYETPKNVETQSPTGKEYTTLTEALKPTKITTPDGKVYNLVPERTEGTESGKVTEAPQNVTYVYELAKGNVTVSYKDTEGNTIEAYETPKDAEKDAPTGKDFNTATSVLKPAKITTPSGKVYNLVPESTEGSESGKVTEAPQNVTYVYELAKGNVTVTYKDTEGNKIEGYETPKDAEKDAPTGKDFNTAIETLKPAKITTPSGKIYNIVPTSTEGAETGKVTEAPQNVTYVYELAKGNVTVTYKDTEGNKIPGYETPKNVETQSPTGKEYTTVTEALKPIKITTPDGKVYNLVPTRTEGNETGKVTEAPQNVTYVYELAKGNVTVTYKDTEGNTIEGYETPKDAEKDVPTGKDFNTNTPELKPAKITTSSGKVYNLVPTRTEGAETGKVTETPQKVTYVYELVKGNVTVTYKDTEGNKIEGYETPKEAEKDAPTGKDFNTATEALKPAKITTPSGKVYNLVPERTEGTESGKVTEAPQNVTYVYELVKGNVTVTYKDTEGNTIEGYETPKDAEKDAPTGKDFNTATPELKPTKITTSDGKVYNLVPTRTEGAETGKVTEVPQNVTYVYELAKGDVTVTYKDTEGNKIPGYETPKNVETQSPTGKAYTTVTEALKPTKITTPSGKVYNLVPERTEGTESGKVTETPQNVTYVYELVKGDVTVKYETETGETIKPNYNLKSKVPTGEEYNTTTVKDLTITKDGKVYKLVETNGGIKDGSSNEIGKVTETPAVVTYVYTEVKGEIIQKFVNESGKEIKDPTNTGKKSLNEKVSLKYPNRITDKDGKVYEFVKVDKVPTKFTEQPQTATYTYRAVKGQGVTVSYETTTGITLKETQTVMPKDSQLGTDYDTTTSTLKPERIEKNGKVYLLQEKTKVGSAEEKGKVTEQPQNVTYVYEEVTEPESKQKYGNVIVTYVDKFGHPLSGLTEKGIEVNKSVIDTPASLVKTPYDTTDNKPETITTKDGKVYKLTKVAKTSDAENSDVKGRTSVITYIYELLNSTEVLPETHIGFVVVNYVDENGLPIFGKDSIGKEVPTTVIDVNGELVGEKYDTRDHKPSTIIAANGDVYEFVKVSDTQNSESGELKEGVTTVEYIYKKVITSYVDEKGKEINPSDKGTKYKKEIPEYIYKETKKDKDGNTIHIYRKNMPSTPSIDNKKTTIWKDESGKVLKPEEKGTKDKGKISGYEYVRTVVDKEGNIVHIFRKLTPPINPEQNKTTIWKDESGKVLRPEAKGTKNKGKISGYEYVRTIVDKDGNTVHIFRKVTVITPVESSKQKEENKTMNKVQTKRLANTGTTQENTGLAGLGLALLSATLVAIKRRKR